MDGQCSNAAIAGRHIARPSASWLAVAGIALLAMWPVLLNGGPFYMPDTPSYFHGAASAVFKCCGLTSSWTDEFFRVYETASAPGVAAAPSVATPVREPPVTLSGRSIYYGAFLYFAYLAGSVWLVAVIQAVLTAITIMLTVEAIGRVNGMNVRPAHTFVIGAVAALGTSLGYFSGYLMPDIFSGIGVLAAANLLFLWSEQTRASRIFCIAVLAYAALVHSTNLMIISVGALVALVCGRWRGVRFNALQLAAVGLCILTGVLGQMLFSQAVKASTGARPVRPPFIAARLIADGPGHQYLKENCSRESYVYCRATRQSQPQSDVLLWSADPAISIFRGLPPREQRLAAAEQPRFVAAVVADKPLAVLKTAGANTVSQLLGFDLLAFHYGIPNRNRFEQTLPAVLLKPARNTLAYRDVMPIAIVEVTTAILAVSAVTFMIIFLMSGRNWTRSSGRLQSYCLCVLIIVGLNAAICGALSGPKGRYQMRLIWILPVIGSAIALSARATSYALPDE